MLARRTNAETLRTGSIGGTGGIGTLAHPMPGNGLEVALVLPDVHLVAAVVTRLVPTHVTEEGIEPFEGTTTVLAAPQLSTDVVKGQGVGGLASIGALHGQLQALGCKEASVTMRALEGSVFSSSRASKVSTVWHSSNFS